MPIDVETEVGINRARDDVAAFASDPGNARAWYANIERADLRTPPPLAVGSQMDFVARFLGRRLTYTYEVREYEPGRRLVMSTSNGRFEMETTYSWVDGDGGTTIMRLRNRGEPAGFSKLLGPIMGVAVRRANRKDLSQLKRILESES